MCHVPDYIESVNPTFLTIGLAIGTRDLYYPQRGGSGFVGFPVNGPT